MKKQSIRIKRVYEAPAADDGVRVLVDRLWPRGLSKADAHVDHWLKELAPSAALRQWFDHDPRRWVEFQRRYRRELEASPSVAALRDLAKRGTITLLFAAKEPQYNNAAALRDYLARPQRASDVKAKGETKVKFTPRSGS